MANVLMKAEGVVTIDVPADPILVGANISLAPIYFMQGKDQILSGSYAELNRLYDVLKANPSLQIRIEGHTDNVGDAFALFELSQKRAVAIKQYLVKAGIQSFRIKTKGFGPKQPLNDNSTETLRQANRRVEVVITQV
jgi:outer membrane protein OmpA-like peptidoglycan-associated protein